MIGIRIERNWSFLLKSVLNLSDSLEILHKKYTIFLTNTLLKSNAFKVENNIFKKSETYPLYVKAGSPACSDTWGEQGDPWGGNWENKFIPLSRQPTN